MGFHHKAYPFQECVFKDSPQPKQDVQVEQREDKTFSETCAGCRADKHEDIQAAIFPTDLALETQRETQPLSEAPQVLLPMFLQLQGAAVDAQMIPKPLHSLFSLHGGTRKWLVSTTNL